MGKISRVEDGESRSLIGFNGRNFPCIVAFSKTQSIFAQKDSVSFSSESREFSYNIGGIREASRYIGM